MYLSMKQTSLLAAAFMAVTAFCAPATAQSSLPPAVEDIVKIEVLPGWRGSDGQHMAALRIKLADGWKTYWRAPGQSGIPPSLNWSGSENLAGVKFHWPVPEVYDIGGMQTIGYEQELVLPMTLVPKSADKPIALNGKVNLGVCKDVCIPADAAIAVALPAQGAGSKAPIKRALRQRPDTAKEAGLRGAVCDVEPISDGLRVTVNIDMPKLGPNEVVVVETADPSVWVSEISTKRNGRGLTTVTELVPSSGKPFLLNRSDLRLTVLAAGRGVDIRGCTGS